jgi:hypothetical protein
MCKVATRLNLCDGVVQPVKGRVGTRKRAIDELRHDRHAVEAVGEDDNGGATLERTHGECLEPTAVVIAPLKERAGLWFEPPAQPPSDLGVAFRHVGGETLDAATTQCHLRRKPEARGLGFDSGA